MNKDKRDLFPCCWSGHQGPTNLYSHLSLPCPMSIIVLIISCWGLWPRQSCLTCVVERTISSTFVYTACRWPIGNGSHKRRTKTRRHTHSSYTHVSIHVFALKTAFPLSFESLSIFFWNLRTGSEDVHATPPTNSSLCFMWGLVVNFAFCQFALLVALIHSLSNSCCTQTKNTIRSLI